MHHIGIGAEHAGAPARVLIHDLDIIIHRDTGEISANSPSTPPRTTNPADPN